MKLKITLPESIEDITLEQFQRYSELLKREDVTELDFIKRKVEIFSNIRYHDLDNVSQKDFEDIIKQIDTALNQDAPFKDSFEMMGYEFGFIPNFDKLTVKETVDLSLYPVIHEDDDYIEKLEKIKNYHKLMAILFRPIKKRDAFNNYSITNYNGTEKFAKIMKQMPMSLVNGSLVFFYHLTKELQLSIQRSTDRELLKEQKHPTTSVNGDGILQ